MKYNLLVADAETVGFTPRISYAAMHPRGKACRLERQQKEQVRQLVEQKGAFTSSALWNICGTRVCNAGLVI